MLPTSVIELTDGFIQHYDAENPAAIIFREFRNSVLGSWAARGFHCWQYGAVVQIGSQLRLFVQKRGCFILEKLQEVVIATDIEYYADLDSDLNAYLTTQLNQTIGTAKNYIEQMRLEANAPIGTTVEALQSFQNVLVGLHADVNLFCAKYSSKSKNPAIRANSVNIEHFAGVFGNVANSQVTIYDYSFIHKLLKENGVPQAERNQIENIMDELQTTPPEMRQSLTEMGKEWIVRNKELLGAGAEMVAKAIGAWSDK